jgi:murein DD-endopeptidase MepM/ murein hydrolase activator NlpD
MADARPRAYPPLGSANTSYGKPGYIDKAFTLHDPQGMYPRPPGYHGAWDWFASGGTPVKAARTGKVTEVKPSLNNTGQVFGGVVKVTEDNGHTWVYRHVVPNVKLGQVVNAGQQIASVVNWIGGPSHLHMEIWETLAGGYNLNNAIDPSSYAFSSAYRGENKPEPPKGSTLRLVLNGRQWAGWDEAADPLIWISRNGLKRNAVASLAFAGRIYRGSTDVTNVAKNLVRNYLT